MKAIVTCGYCRKTFEVEITEDLILWVGERYKEIPDTCPGCLKEQEEEGK